MGSITDTPDTVVNVYDFSDKKNAKKKEAYIMEGEIQNIILDSQNGIIKISTVIRNVHNQFRLIPEPFYTKMSWIDQNMDSLRRSSTMIAQIITKSRSS